MTILPKTFMTMALAIVAGVGCNNTTTIDNDSQLTGNYHPLPLLLQIEGELVPYEDGRMWIDASDDDWRGIDVVASDETANNMFISDEQIWHTIPYGSYGLTVVETEDGIETVYWNYELNRDSCFGDRAACTREIRIAMEPRLQRDSDDGLWRDDPSNWVTVEITLPTTSLELEYDAEADVALVPSMLIEVNDGRAVFSDFVQRIELNTAFAPEE